MASSPRRSCPGRAYLGRPSRRLADQSHNSGVGRATRARWGRSFTLRAQCVIAVGKWLRAAMQRGQAGRQPSRGIHLNWLHAKLAARAYKAIMTASLNGHFANGHR